MSTIDLIPEVSSLTMRFTDTLDMHTSLVHKCANTLVSLNAVISNAKTLFYDANENIVVYPQLEVLSLAATTGAFTSDRVSVPNVLPLPSLKSLYVGIPYLYTDDVLFRGNSASLKGLVINIDQNTVNVLNRNQVFRNNYKNLKVIIEKTYPDEDLTLISDADMNKFFSSLVGTARTLKLASEVSFNYLIAAAPPNGFEYLQALCITKDNMALFDVLRLLKALPSLIKIACGFDSLGSELENIAANDLPNYITSTYCNTGKNLQIISNQGIGGLVRPVVTEYVILLALVCPKLRRVDLTPDGISDFQGKVAKALQSIPYSKYTSELDRLLCAVY
ncbi:hypothetical protein GGI16_004587 [Coemansia sp. S142-1]|nr:hypothetical protein GGI16_004587 [Coemansia sp. S142-1]